MAKSMQRRLRRRITQSILSVCMFTGVTLIRCLPLAFNRLLARAIGHLLFCIPSYRRVIVANLAVAFPDWDSAHRLNVGRQSLQNIALSFLESMWLLSHPKRIGELFSIDTKTLAAAQSQQQPIVFVSPHLGNWELVQMGLNANDIPCSAIAAPITNAYLQSQLHRCRTAYGGEVIASRGAARGILSAFKNMRSIAMLIDQNTKTREGGIYVRFFDLPVPVSRAPAVFARRVNAAIVVIFCIRQSNNTYVLQCRTLSKPVGDYTDDQEVTQEITSHQEALIRQFPEQYLWLYQRWRYIPSDWPQDQTTAYPYYCKRDSAPEAVE